jgi:hypothetical protein
MHIQRRKSTLGPPILSGRFHSRNVDFRALHPRFNLRISHGSRYTESIFDSQIYRQTDRQTINNKPMRIQNSFAVMETCTVTVSYQVALFNDKTEAINTSSSSINVQLCDLGASFI